MLLNKPLVSVVIPFYNRLNWVIESINSVLDQTYDNWEIILVDDGSDNQNKIPENILSNKRITLLTQENKGPASARNKGIKIAKGKYIAFLDSDDLFSPKKLEEQVAFMENNPNISLSYTSYQYIDETGKILQSVDLNNAYNTYPEIIFCCLIATPTVLIKKEILSSDYLFNESIRIGEDVILWSNIAKSYKLALMNNVLTHVRLHEKSTAFCDKAQFIGQNNILNYFLKKENKNNHLKSRLLSGKAQNMYANKLYVESFFLSLHSIFCNPSNKKGWFCISRIFKRLIKIPLSILGLYNKKIT